MQKRKSNFKLPGGGTLVIEQEVDWSQANRIQEDRPDFFERSREFSDAVECIRPVVDQVMQPLRALESKPEEIELTFNFSFGGESELILREQGEKSHIQIKLKYGKDSLR